MRAITSISLWIVRVAGTLQLLLGTLFWTGHAYTYVPLHIINGALIVLTLWTVAVLALTVRTQRRLAVVALVWGVALPAFGIRQVTMLLGPMHWVIRVIHLLMGLIAMALAGTLGQAILASAPARNEESEAAREAVLLNRAR